MATFGKTSAGALLHPWTGNYIHGYRCLLQEEADVSSIVLLIRTTTDSIHPYKIRCGIYRDVNGVPDVFIAETNEIALANNSVYYDRWLELPFETTIHLPPGYYWLAYRASWHIDSVFFDGNSTVLPPSQPSQLFFIDTPYDQPWTSPMGPQGYAAMEISIYATYTPIAVPSEPVATFSYTPASPLVNETIQFTDNSYDLDGTIVARSWDFGDGGASTLTNPTYAYSSTGQFNVTLTVTDNDGLTNAASKTLTILLERAGMCFIATAAYGSPLASELDVLRSFRDQFLLRNKMGECLVNAYYHIGKYLAYIVARSQFLRSSARMVLNRIIKALR